MDMLGLDIQLQRFQPVLLPQQLIKLLPRVLRHLILENPVAVLWTKHDMVFTLVECAREFSESLADDVSP